MPTIADETRVPRERRHHPRRMRGKRLNHLGIENGK